MVFSTTVFLFLFLPIVLLLYYCPICKCIQMRNLVLVTVSLAFYAWGEPFYILLMIISILINYMFANLIECSLHKRFFLCIAIIYNVGILFVFKYLTFVMGIFKIHISGIALPIGISFYTFQALSYVIDVYRGEKAEKNLINVALYISFFPQLIAGPIVRYNQIAAQIKKRGGNYRQFEVGVGRFIVGLAKKVIIANNIGILADEIFRYAGSMSIATAWLGAVAYSLQIYYDFSGYSDMAIGLGGMFGFRFSENFKFPYISQSITEFWRRWHISLSRWFRDYIYIPLGGNRCSKIRNIVNLAIIWFLTGMWHGASWNFILWGMLYFALLVAEKNIKGFCHNCIIRHFYTMFFVIMLWVLFRAGDVHEALVYWGNMFNIFRYEFIDDRFIELIHNFVFFIVVAVIFSCPVSVYLYKWLPRKIYNCLNHLWKIFCFFITITYMVSSTYNPFIYFNF